ncbi:MAG TPA: penicillin-binding transpeptidase domain-containing protein [Puia sp.]
MTRSPMSGPLFAFLLISCLFTACSQNNVTEDNSFKRYFDSAGVSGSFGLFDNGQGHFTIYHLSRFRDSAFLPAGTFDIIQSLIGVQTGLVKDDSALIKTDRENGFGQLAQRIGKDTLKKWIDSLGYGNKNISGPIDSFWLNNHLKVTSDEQLGLVKKLYFDQLPFFQHTQVVVRRMMLTEKNANYQLTYKTALGLKEDGHTIGWILGWIEENKHPYFFVLNLESANPNLDVPGSGIAILKSILKQMEFFQGKK